MGQELKKEQEVERVRLKNITLRNQVRQSRARRGNILARGEGIFLREEPIARRHEEREYSRGPRIEQTC
eukprot:1418783-Pyramimonas_sp.AAC.1